MKQTRTIFTAFAIGVVLLSLVVPAGANPPPPRPAPAPRPGPVATVAGVATVVTLVTGDRVEVSTAGGAITLPPGHPFLSLGGPGGDRYVVPAAALRYVGRQLDWSMFDVTALARAGSRTPVALRFAAGTAPSAPPGVRFTSVTGGTARGYVSDGSALAGALRTLPRGLVRMRLDVPAPAGTVSPHLPLHIVAVQATDLAGAPAATDVFVYDLDILSRANGLGVPVESGTGRVALPAGHFLAITPFTDLSPDGQSIAATRMVATTFIVPDTGSPAPVSVDERTATSRVSVTTPRPADQRAGYVSLTALDDAGHAGSFLAGLGDASGGDVYVAPTPTPTPTPTPSPSIGRLRMMTDWIGTSPAGVSPSYRYDVAFASDGVPADQAHVVTTAQLATVRSRLFADPGSAGADGGSYGAQPNDPVVPGPTIGFGFGVAAPSTVTDYVGTAAGGQWFLNVGSGSIGYSADVLRVAPRHSYSIDWAHGPHAPGFGQHTGLSVGPCLACTAGDRLAVIFADLAGDSVPSHGGFLGEPTTLELYRDGQQLTDWQPYGTASGILFGAVESGIPAQRSTYRVVFDLDRSDDPTATQSTRTHTDLTFRYDPRPDPGSRMPADVACIEPWGPDSCVPGASASTPAYVLPVLSLSYRLASDRTDTSHAPVQAMGLDVGHLSYDGQGSRARITSARVGVSFDGGASWQDARVAGSGGHYVATWPNAANTHPWLRVTATDAAGGSITQVIENAYTVGATS